MSTENVKVESRSLGRWDRVGMFASMLCAVHCVALGLLAGILPLVGTAIVLNWIWEITFVAGAIIIGGYTVVRSYTIHRRRLPLTMLIVGVVLLIGSKIWHLEAHVHHGHVHVHAGEAILAALGGIAIAAAHFINLRFRAACSAV